MYKEINLNKIKDIERLLRLLRKPLVIKIIDFLSSQEEEINVSEIYSKLNLGQSDTSFFLSKLKKYQIVTFHKEKQKVFYGLNGSKLDEILNFLNNFQGVID